MNSSPTKQNTAPNQAPENTPHGGVLDSEIAQNIEDDPFLRFLSKHSKTIITVAIIVGALWFAKNRFQQTYIQSMQRAGDLLSGASADLKTVTAQERELQIKQLTAAPVKQDKEQGKEQSGEQSEELAKLAKAVEEAENRINGSLSSLATEKEPYPEIAKLYQTILLLSANGSESIDVVNWKNLQSAKPGDLLIVELRALAGFRAGLDNEKVRPQAIAGLRELVRGSRYVGVPALSVLNALAADEASRQELAVLAQQFASNHPEQRELLQQLGLVAEES
jgi:hypothetical protein